MTGRAGAAPRKPPSLSHHAEAALWKSAIGPLGRISPPAAAPLARGMARLAFDVARLRRSVTLDNLERAFPDRSTGERVRIGRSSYEHSLLSVYEFERLARKGLDGFHIEVAGEDIVWRLKERGAFIATVGHFGAWELLPHYWADRGVSITALYKPMHNPILDDRFLRVRRRSGARFLSTRLSGREVWRELLDAVKQGDAIVFLADQDARRDGVFVPFFGRPASTATGPATLALRCGLPILPVSCTRLSPGRFRIDVEDPIQPPEGGRTMKNVVSMTADHTEALERRVLHAPEQYMWMHKRWKTASSRARRGKWHGE